MTERKKAIFIRRNGGLQKMCVIFHNGEREKKG